MHTELNLLKINKEQLEYSKQKLQDKFEKFLSKEKNSKSDIFGKSDNSKHNDKKRQKFEKELEKVAFSYLLFLNIFYYNFISWLKQSS